MCLASSLLAGHCGNAVHHWMEQDASLRTKAIFSQASLSSLLEHEAQLLSEGAAAATVQRRESEATARRICSDQRDGTLMNAVH